MNDSVTARRLAEELDLELIGSGTRPLTRVATIESADENSLTFLANPAYRKYLPDCRAGAVILARDNAMERSGDLLIAENPYAAYARAAAFFEPPMRSSGVAASADIEASATLGDGCHVGAHTSIGAGAIVGAGTRIGAGVVIEDDVTIGAQCLIHPRVTLARGVTIGDRVIVHPGAVIGSDGFGIAFDAGEWVKVPQLGSVVIGDDCEIGANTTIDRGALGDTVLGCDVRLDNQIQIAHNVVIGDHTAIAGCSAIAGSARVGSRCLIAGGVGILGHLEVCDNVTVTAMSLVTRSIREPGEYSSGTPLQPNRDWRRNAVRMRQLDEMARTLKNIEKRK